ncbi:cathepsin B-like [Lycorma delicatula]|uniref:cathepsin B-like n=1 Tax=Lycorma delicatula TaxID=130591 RepID=UPI003F51082E
MAPSKTICESGKCDRNVNLAKGPVLGYLIRIHVGSDEFNIYIKDDVSKYLCDSCSRIPKNGNETLPSGVLAGHNFFPSISPSSLKYLCITTFDQEYEGPFKTYHSSNINRYKSIPKEFDARKNWPKCRKTISHVQDQGDCGSYWAIAAAEVLTDRVCIASKGRKKAQLSTEDLLSCCTDCGHGCEGGSPWFAWQYFQKHGIVTGGDYLSHRGCKLYSFQPCEHHINGSMPQCSSLGDLPTPTCHYRCTNSRHDHSFWRDHHRDKLTANSTRRVARDILEKGPAEAAFLVFEDFLAYKSGICQHITGNKLGGHAVKLIGWGEENGVPYWLVLNSWNTDWGDNGYFKIKMGSNECGFESFVLAGTADYKYP